MTSIALGIAALLLAAAVPIVVSLSRRILAQGAQLDTLDEVLACQRRRIDSLNDTLELQRDTISLLSEHNGELEDRNACLERVQRRNLHAAVMACPVVRWVDPEGEVRQISMN